MKSDELTPEQQRYIDELVKAEPWIKRPKTKRCKHELIVGTCATCLGTDKTPVPDPFEGAGVEELDPERDLGGAR